MDDDRSSRLLFTQRFTTRVRDYVAHRPDDPVEYLMEIIGELPRDGVAADIGMDRIVACQRHIQNGGDWWACPQ